MELARKDNFTTSRQVLNPPTEVRLDKWLWAVRLFKTRTLAADACKAGHVRIAGQNAKPSHTVRLQETITARTGELTRTVKVIGLLEKRVSAKLISQFLEDHTPASEYQKPKEPYFPPLFQRAPGRGRPTKKDRRKIDSFRRESGEAGTVQS